MNSIAAAGSIEAVNTILQIANQASIEAAEKLMKVSVEMTVGAECGKGAAVDLSA
ncbi:MAG: hypothetical protein JXA18_16375 [Chitinispirillaceae bacterium]|nr:hypothetical protein [Chitinispirillaceae bacterium]